MGGVFQEQATGEGSAAPVVAPEYFRAQVCRESGFKAQGMGCVSCVTPRGGAPRGVLREHIRAQVQGYLTQKNPPPLWVTLGP